MRACGWARTAIALGLIGAAAGFAVSVCAQEMTVAQWGAALVRPTLAGAGIEVDGKAMSYGHLELRLSSGRLYPVVVADRALGVYFVGRGTFHYTSADPFEAATYRTNVERISAYKVDRDGSITDGVGEFLLMLSDGADAIGAGSSWRNGAPPPDALASFAKHLQRFGQDDARGPALLLPPAIRDPQAAPAVAVEIVADKHDLRYSIDPFRDHDEWIEVMKRYWDRIEYHDLPFLKERRYTEMLSDQFIDRRRLEPVPVRFAVRAVDVTLVNPGGLRADLEVTEVFQALTPLRVLDLGLWSHRAGTEGATGRPQQHDYVVTEVSLAGGQNLPFSHRDDELLIELPSTLQPGQTVTVHARVSGDVLFNPGNDSYWELPTAPWFPNHVRLEGQYATYHAVVKVKKPFIAFSCGRTVRRWEEGELACAEFREDRPIQIPVILAGKYTTTSEERNGLIVRVSSYFAADKQGVKKLINLAFTLVDFYKTYFGDYPFAELNIIEINSYGFGQAPAGVVFITKEAFTPLQDDVTRVFSQGVNHRLAHEIAHAWWGHVAKLAFQDQWLSESVADYFAAFAMGKLWRGLEFDKAFSNWRGLSKYVKEKGSVYMANSLAGERAWEDRVALLYGKGPLVLHALRHELGDDNFFTVFKSFLKNFNFKVAQTRHFIGLTNFVAKKDYTDWFNRYLLGTEWPEG